MSSVCIANEKKKKTCKKGKKENFLTIFFYYTKFLHMEKRWGFFCQVKWYYGKIVVSVQNKEIRPNNKLAEISIEK